MTAEASSSVEVLRDLVALTKPRLSSMVLITTAGGLWLAGGRLAAPSTWAALLGTTLAVAGAHSLNCYLERDLDRVMARTRNRPLPAGRLDPRVALWFGLATGLASIPLLWFGVNPVTSFLGALALGSYVLWYTPLKTRSPWALHVGALPGALPPLMGWTAARGQIEPAGLVLFAILFVWQLPHFLAISLYRRDDYERAGMKTAPTVWGESATRLHMAAYTALLLPLSVMLVSLRVAGWWYGTAAIALGTAFLVATLPGLQGDPGKPWARKVFLYSLVYNTGLFLALCLDRL
ncbi:MAG: protoheme IX farnesyltransferase [Myxococcales bacterium]|nr:protoheme IX farnesyltransferase [Myxococcales bacterium]